MDFVLRTLIIDTLNKIGKPVLLKGWVNIRRDHGKIIFIDLRDRSGLIQVVVDPQKISTELHPQDVIEVEGKVVSRPEKLINKNIPTGTVELQVEKIIVLTKAEELPFDMGSPQLNMELPTILDYRGLTLRHPKISAVFKVQEIILQTFRAVLKQQGFTEISVPTIVATATEGGSEVFPIEYFDKKAYLAQSPQFYKQVMVGVFERVFTAAHAYRAEPSVTTRHMTEYIGLDAEMGFITDWTEVLEMAELVVKAIFKAVKDNCLFELKLFNASLPKVSTKIPKVKLSEAQEIIYKRTKVDHRDQPDLDPEDEREICRWALEEKGSDLVFITHYPTKKRPMYTYPDPHNPKETLSFDLIGKGVEWITGGQRINNYEQLITNMRKWGCDPKDFEFPYLQAFKYGMPPEGGFCLGLERITQNILGLNNVREATLFPRDMTRIDIRLSSQAKKSSDSGITVYKKIIILLKERAIDYQEFEHEPVLTSEQAAQARGTAIGQGAKALVMMADSLPIMLVISAAYKIDTKKFKHLFNIEDLKMATPEEVEKITGTKVGAVPPFGNLFSLPTYVEETLGVNKKIAFNAGLHTKSIEVSFKDYISIVKPQFGSFHQ